MTIWIQLKFSDSFIRKQQQLKSDPHIVPELKKNYSGKIGAVVSAGYVWTRVMEVTCVKKLFFCKWLGSLYSHTLEVKSLDKT